MLPSMAIAQDSLVPEAGVASQRSLEDPAVKRQLASDIVALISGAKDVDTAVGQASEQWIQAMTQRNFQKRGFADIEKKHPGYSKKVAEAISPIIRTVFINSYPALRDEQIDIWAERLDEADLRKIARFFSTSFFRKMAAILHNPPGDDFSPEGQLIATSAALNAITEADIKELESNPDFDEKMAISMELALTSWTKRLESWSAELSTQMEGEIAEKVNQINADFFK